VTVPVGEVGVRETVIVRPGDTRQDIATALVVKLGIAGFVVLGMVPLRMAVAFGDMGLSPAVIANALRIGRPGTGI